MLDLATQRPDAESLFFINHHQAEILEYDIAGDKPMSANDDIDAAFAQQL